MSTTELDRALHQSVLKREAWKEQKYRAEKEQKDEEIRLGFGATDMCQEELKKIIDSDRRMYYRTVELNDKLYIHYKGWKEIKGLEGWTGLRALYAECNAFDRIQGLQNCRNLRSLFLSENCIHKIEGLECCTELWSLNLSSNFLERIEGLSNLKKLNTLIVAKNKIGMRGVEDLIELKDTSINSLDVQDNKIWDPDVLPEVFTHMPDLRVLYLKGNPCSKRIPNYRKSITVYCADLRYLDDRPVFVEDRRAAEAFNRGGIEEERAERRRMRQENDAKHAANMRAFQAMIDAARAEKRERTAMRSEDKYTDDTDPVEDPEKRMQRQVDKWKEEHADELKDDARERAEASLRSERERGEAPPPPETSTVASEAQPAEDTDDQVAPVQGAGEEVEDKRKLVYEDIWDDLPPTRAAPSTGARPAFAPPPRRPPPDPAGATDGDGNHGGSASGVSSGAPSLDPSRAAPDAPKAPAWYAKFAEISGKDSGGGGAAGGGVAAASTKVWIKDMDAGTEDDATAAAARPPAESGEATGAELEEMD
mmetsp:Transcript_106785/g.308900  ORF Transcript_106785/g.308900 Transcript_106785/m.308900 type:complete len:537 (+) Transcript_106785:69-1679(+)